MDTTKTAETPKTAVIYARTSSERGDRDRNGKELKTADQIQLCQELAAKNGLQVLGIYKDDDYSGALWPDVPEAQSDRMTLKKYNGKRRPDFTKVMQHVLSGQIGYVVVWSTTRIARPISRTFYGYIGDTFQSCEVKIWSVAKGILDYSDFMQSIADNMESGFLRKEINTNVMAAERTRKTRYAQGFLRAPPAYGFKSFGKQHVQVNQAEADTVKAVFTSYLEGKGVTEIIRHLIANGHKTRHNKVWFAETILNILANPACIAKYKDGNGTLQPSPVYSAIVEDSTYFAAQAKLADRNKLPNRSKGTFHDYPLSGGMLKCAECGTNLRGANIKGSTRGDYVAYYYCPNVVCKSRVYVRCEDLHNLINFVWSNRETHFAFAFNWVRSMTKSDFTADTQVIELQTALDKIETIRQEYGTDIEWVSKPKEYKSAMATLDKRQAELSGTLESLRIRMSRPLPADTDVRAIAQYLCDSIAVKRRQWIALTFSCGCYWKISAKLGKRKAYGFLPLSQAETEQLPKLAQAFATMPHTVADWSEVATDAKQLDLDIERESTVI